MCWFSNAFLSNLTSNMNKGVEDNYNKIE